MAAIQAAVDQFRADLGGPNNGIVAGTQPSGRREINWDGGGAAAPPTFDPSPMTRFDLRGATFLTPGNGFETSGAPNAEFADINPGYPALFAPFSPPRLFIARNTNVMDAVFNVPGDATTAAGVSGFGAVFTDVDVAAGTRLQFFAPDGALLFERVVPATVGNETQSFLGVSFDRGEIVGSTSPIRRRVEPRFDGRWSAPRSSSGRLLDTFRRDRRRRCPQGIELDAVGLARAPIDHDHSSPRLQVATRVARIAAGSGGGHIGTVRHRR